MTGIDPKYNIRTSDAKKAELVRDFKKLDTDQKLTISFDEFFAPKAKELKAKNVSYSQLADEIAREKKRFQEFAGADGELNIDEFTALKFFEGDMTPDQFNEIESGKISPYWETRAEMDARTQSEDCSKEGPGSDRSEPTQVGPQEGGRMEQPSGTPEPNPVKLPASEPTTEPATPTPRRLSKADKYAALSYGKDVAEALIGYTDKSDQYTVERIISQSVDKDNVLEFLKGYQDQLPSTGTRFVRAWALAPFGPTGIAAGASSGHDFFEQLWREYDFDIKDDYIKDVATKLRDCLQEKGDTALVAHIDGVLKKAETQELSEADVELLDNVAATAMKAY